LTYRLSSSDFLCGVTAQDESFAQSPNPMVKIAPHLQIRIIQMQGVCQKGGDLGGKLAPDGSIRTNCGNRAFSEGQQSKNSGFAQN
jgi:hypothetical protein